MFLPISLITLCVSLVLLTLYIIIYWRSYVAIPAQGINEDERLATDTPDCLFPAITVVIITHDSDYMLEKMIDRVANQDYPNFEILIVNNASSDNTTNVIRQASVKYPQMIRDTYLPQNRNGILHTSIATTLGIRAARKEWIVLLRPNSAPKTNLWLRSIGAAIRDGHKFCIGYNDYYGYDNSPWTRRAKEWRRKQQILNFRAINRGGCRPIEAENTNIAFRKDDFFTYGGYGRWLSIKNYHENLYATTFVKSETAVMLTHADAQVETLLPPIYELWETDIKLIKRSYAKLSRATKLRRNFYTRLTILFVVSFLIMIAGLILSLDSCTLSIDNSLEIVPMAVEFTPGLSVTLIGLAATAIFLIASLVHYIYKVSRNNRDIRNITVPLTTDPSVNIYNPNNN